MDRRLWGCISRNVTAAWPVGYRRKNSHGEAVPIYRSLYGPLRCDKGFDSDLPDQLTRFFCPVCSSQRDGSEILSGRKGRAFFSKNRSYAVGVLSPVRLTLPDYVYWKRAQIRHRFRAFQPGSSQLQLCFYACFCHQSAEQLYLSAGFE